MFIEIFVDIALIVQYVFTGDRSLSLIQQVCDISNIIYCGHAKFVTRVETLEIQILDTIYFKIKIQTQNPCHCKYYTNIAGSKFQIQL